MAQNDILGPKCIKVWMKPRQAASGVGTQAYQYPSCGKMALLDVEPQAAPVMTAGTPVTLAGAE